MRYHIEERSDIKKKSTEREEIVCQSVFIKNRCRSASVCLHAQHIMATYFRTHSTNLARRILVHRNRDLVSENNMGHVLLLVDVLIICNRIRSF